MVSVLGWPEMLAFVSMVTTVGKNLHKNKQRWIETKKNEGGRHHMGNKNK